MGLAGGLVKKVFSKGRSSAGGRYGNEKNAGAEKGTWRLSKLKFCGDDPESVLNEEDDLLSINSSEATITQPEEEITDETAMVSVTESFRNKETHQCGASNETKHSNDEENPHTKPLEEEDAAIIIQSAFRGFLARCRCKESGNIEEAETSSRVSMCTSTELHAGDSVKDLKFQAESIIQHKVHHKPRPQISHQKEWDDSTVSSNISKLRIQNRLEAMIRRERALAYAFSQQLRTCSTKKRSNQCESHEPNMGWSWLERWMATRIPDNSTMEDCPSTKIERRSPFFRKQFDLALEERESCGSNDISVSSENVVVLPSKVKDSYKPAKNYLKAQKTASQRSNLPGYQYMTRSSKVVKMVSLREAEKEKEHKQMQAKRTEEDTS